MKTMTIQHPERYEAPKVKVKELRKRSVICASLTGMDVNGTEQTDGSDGDFD